MSQQKDVVKQWFQTLDKPSQEQFYNWMDNIRWGDDKIEFNDMSDAFIALINALGQPILKFVNPSLSQYTFTHTIPAGYYVDLIIIKPQADCIVTLNDGNGNINDIDVVALHGEPIAVMYNAGVDRVITIANVPPATVINVRQYKLPI